MKKIVVFTGAGISAESGIPTFRASDGLWAGHDVMEVASIDGWRKNPELVLNFYNERRKNALDAQPNDAHRALADLETEFEVVVVTQNVDNLHERAGSSQVVHLHGELFKSRSSVDPGLVYEIDGWELSLGQQCEKGSQLRPNIVWFGEEVPLMAEAMEIAETADIFMVVGTSLVVYPAANLIAYIPSRVPKYIIDPNRPEVAGYKNLHFVEEAAGKGVPKVAEEIRRRYL